MLNSKSNGLLIMHQKNNKIISMVSFLFLLAGCSSGTTNAFIESCKSQFNPKYATGKLSIKLCECVGKNLKFDENGNYSEDDEFKAMAGCELKYGGIQKRTEAAYEDMQKYLNQF